MWKTAVVVRLVYDVVLQDPVDSAAQESGTLNGQWSLFLLGRLFGGL
jgi:hypothetical protein